MVKQKLVFLASAICILVIVIGGLSLSWNPEDASDVSGDTGVIDDGSTDDVTTPVEVSDGQDDSSSVVSVEFSSATIVEALSDNKAVHESVEDYSWDSSDVIAVTLNSDSISVEPNFGITIDKTTLTITSAGTYSITGTLDDGQVIVDTKDEEIVQLILNGVNIYSSTSAPIFVEDSTKTVIILAEGTENVLTDNKNNPNNATISSKDDLTICGEGFLTVNANSNDAIRSNDGLIIKSGTITVNSVDDGIRGKDYLIINGGTIIVTSTGDGLTSDNDEQADAGYIYVSEGTIFVTCQGDAISAQTDLLVAGGTFKLTSGGGSSAWVSDNLSTKGLKAGSNLVIDGGVFTIDSSDDAVHSNDVIMINSGTFNLASGDDGVHADTTLEINDGTIDISQSYEGLESTTITINGGEIQITASDDGINVAGGNTGNEDFMGGRPTRGWGGFEQAGEYYIYINGGTIYVNSGGDGLDSDGYIEMTDGLVIINGPTSSMNGAIDYGGGSFQLSGGTIIAVGAAGMAQAPSSTLQNVANLQFSSTMSADVLVHIQSASGEDVLTFSPEKTYQSLVFTSPDLEDGTYTVYFGGSTTGTATYGLYEDGIYSGGTEYGSFTVS